MPSLRPGGRLIHLCAIGIGVFAITLAATVLSAAERVYVLTESNWIIGVSTDNPGTILSSIPITGLASGESALGIDFRALATDGPLYVLGSSSRLYRMEDLELGEVVPVAGPFWPRLHGTEFGFDFDPVEDVIRVISDENQILILDPDTGGIISVEPGPTFDDAYDRYRPSLVAASYSRSDGASVALLLYMIDAVLDILVVQDQSAPGTVTGVGPLGVDATDMIGLDVSTTTGSAYAATNVGGRASLYTIDLEDGGASLLGILDIDGAVRGLSIDEGPRPVPVRSASWGTIKAGYREHGPQTTRR